MDARKALREGERAELRLYRALGIEPFRRLMFAVERLRHRRDGARNANYHLTESAPGALAGAMPFLRYNGALHAVALTALLLALLLWRRFTDVSWLWELPFWLLAALDLWCLMLQRYNAIRISALDRLRIARRDAALRERAAQLRGEMGGRCETAAEDLELVRDLLEGLQAGADREIGREDLPSLRRLAALLPTEEARAGGAEGGTCPSADRPLSSVAEQIEPGRVLYTRAERRAAALDRALGHRGRATPLRPFFFRTEDAETERCAGALFPVRRAEAMEERLLLLRLLLTEDRP